LHCEIYDPDPPINVPAYGGPISEINPGAPDLRCLLVNTFGDGTVAGCGSGETDDDLLFEPRRRFRRRFREMR
jgi:hypothetical protein